MLADTLLQPASARTLALTYAGPPPNFSINSPKLPTRRCEQVVVAETLGAWGEAGLAAHLQSVREGYARKAAVVMEAAEQARPGGSLGFQ